MRITQWGEYGIHCCLFIADAKRKGATTVSAVEIAESQNIALQYTQQILQRLRKGEIITSVRGPHGGYALSRASNKITLFDIITAVEGDTFELMCEAKPLETERCAENSPCSLRNFWYDLKEHVDLFLKNKTLADLLIANQSKQIVSLPRFAS